MLPPLNGHFLLYQLCLKPRSQFEIGSESDKYQNYQMTLFFKIILVGAGYHLIRDILQIVEYQNVFTQIGHWGHEWCGLYCNYVTLPIDLFLIVASVVVLKRKKSGILGICVVTVLFLSVIIWFLP